MGDIVSKRIEFFASAARTATATSEPKSLPTDATDIGIAIDTSAFTSGTFTAKVQHSLNGSRWVDLAGAVSTAIAATGIEVKFASAACLPLIRVVLTGASTPVATQSVAVVYGDKK